MSTASSRRRQAGKSLSQMKVKPFQKDNWIKDPSKHTKTIPQKTKFIKDKFCPVFDDIDCVFAAIIVDFCKGKNDILLSRAKLT